MDPSTTKIPAAPSIEPRDAVEAAVLLLEGQLCEVHQRPIMVRRISGRLRAVCMSGPVGTYQPDACTIERLTELALRRQRASRTDQGPEKILPTAAGCGCAPSTPSAEEARTETRSSERQPGLLFKRP
jgi:hypothetical protein